MKNVRKCVLEWNINTEIKFFLDTIRGVINIDISSRKHSLISFQVRSSKDR